MRDNKGPENIAQEEPDNFFFAKIVFIVLINAWGSNHSSTK